MKIHPMTTVAALVLSSLALSAVAQDKKSAVIPQTEINLQAGSSPVGEALMHQNSNAKAPPITAAAARRI